MTPEFGEPRSLVGRAVADRAGSRFGEIEDVFVERGTDEPAFALISMGRFGSLGRRLTVVPLAGARPAEENDEIILAVDEDRVRSAPEFSSEAQLSGEQETEIEAYYGLEASAGAETGELPGGDGGPAPESTATSETDRGAGSPGPNGPASQGPTDPSPETAEPAAHDADPARGPGDAPARSGDDTAPSTGGEQGVPAAAAGGAPDEGGERDRGSAAHDDADGIPRTRDTAQRPLEGRESATNGDAPAPGRSGSPLPEPPAEGVLVSEEQLEVSHTQAVRERVRLVKEIVVEEVQITVPLRREVLRLERISVPDDPTEEDEVVDELSEEAFEVLLKAEEPVIGKRVVPVERVRVTKEVVTEEAEITEQLRKERVEVETIGDA